MISLQFQWELRPIALVLGLIVPKRLIDVFGNAIDALPQTVLGSSATPSEE